VSQERDPSPQRDAPPPPAPRLPVDDAGAPVPAAAEGGGGVIAWVWDVIRTWTPAILAVLLVRSLVAEPFRIPSGSMVPTLAIGDHIVVTKFTYGLRWPLTRVPIGELEAPARGDVVVFVYPGSDTGINHWVDLPIPGLATYDYVKRVVGLPGDAVEVRDNIVHINGKPMAREYKDDYTFIDDRCSEYATRHYTEDLDGVVHDVLNARSYGARMGDFGPVEVPPGEVFVMGDNRDHSADSRVWGFVPLRNIKGKARFVWLSYDFCDPERAGPFPTLRGGRFGEGIR